MGDSLVIPNSPEYQLYEDTINSIRAAHLGSALKYADYWWGLHVIWRDKLWKCVMESGSTFNDWLAELRSESWAPSLQGFYNVNNAIETWRKMGKETEEEIKEMLAASAQPGKKMALCKQLADAALDRKGNIRPEFEEKLAESKENPEEFLDRLAGMSGTEAVAEMSSFSSKVDFYAERDSCKIGDKNISGTVVMKKGDEVLGSYRVTVTLSRLPPGRGKDIPGEIIDWVYGRLKFK